MIKNLIKQQLSKHGVTQEEFCEAYNKDYTNFSKAVKKIERDIEKARKLLNLLNIEIEVKIKEN